MSEVHAIAITEHTTGQIDVKRLNLDLRAFEAETIYAKTYADGELDLDAAFAWCEGHGYERTYDDGWLRAFVHKSLPDRVDMARLPDGTVRVALFDRRGRRDVRRGEPFFVAGRTLEELDEFLCDAGYHGYVWHDGARAFRGQPWPIRTRSEIWKMRRRLEDVAVRKMQREPGKWHPEETLLSLDLAYAG